MEQEKPKRTINRHYIGVVKEIHDSLKFVEVEIPQESILIDEIEAMKENGTRTLMDVQQLFTQFYPEKELQYKHYDYLFPLGYGSAYVSGVGYPKILTYDEYKERLEKHEAWLRDEENLFSYYDDKDELKKLKEDSEEKYAKKVDEIVRDRMQKYVNQLRKGFQYQRFIFAHRYTVKLKEIKENPNVKMWSTDQIGWKEFEYKVNDDITVYIKSNFGYGSASYFFCNLKYKDINILPYTAIIKYYYVQMVDFIRYTRRYSINRESWAEVFDFAVLTANMAKHEPLKFVKVWIVNEVEEMMQGMRKIMSSPVEELEYYLKFNQKIEIASYHIFRNCTTRDRKDYEVLPNEKVIAFKAEKITGCLLLLDNLRKLTEIAPIIVPYIEEIEQMNLRIRPEIEAHIVSLSKDIEKLEDSLNIVLKELERLSPIIERHKEEIEKLRKEINEKRKDGWQIGTWEAENEYKKKHPEYVRVKTENDEQTAIKEKLERRIERRKRFLEILNKCKKRIAKYVLAA